MSCWSSSGSVVDRRSLDEGLVRSGLRSRDSDRNLVFEERRDVAVERATREVGRVVGVLKVLMACHSISRSP